MLSDVMVQMLKTAKQAQNSHFYIAGESIKIKLFENSSLLGIAHVTDFEYDFADVDLSPTSTS